MIQTMFNEKYVFNEDLNFKDEKEDLYSPTTHQHRMPSKFSQLDIQDM